MMDCVSVTDAEARTSQPLCLAIELPGRTYYIKADDKEALRGWKQVCACVYLCVHACVCLCVHAELCPPPQAFSAFVEVPRSLSVVSRPSDEVCQVSVRGECVPSERERGVCGEYHS